MCDRFRPARESGRRPRGVHPHPRRSSGSPCWRRRGPRNRIRGLIVRQANQYLTATLSIGRLEGSLLRGIAAGDVSVARDGRTLIQIDESRSATAFASSCKRGVVIRRVHLTRPRIVGGRSSRTGAGTSARSSGASRASRSAPVRAGRSKCSRSRSIDGRISLRDPLDFGAAHVPTDFEPLNASFSFAYVPVRWTLTFDRVSWIGHAPDLSVSRLAGMFGRGPGGWFFEHFSVHTARSAFTLDGRDQHVDASRPCSTCRCARRALPFRNGRACCAA